MAKLPKRHAIKDHKNGIAYIPLGRYISHGFAIVDIEDSWVDKYWWHTDTNGYPIANKQPYVRGGGPIYLHRLICECPEGMMVDHINHKVKDARRSNLRPVTSHQNMHNKRPHKASRWGKRTSKYKGVCMVKHWKIPKWQYALYSKDIPGGKDYGYVDTEREAALKYNELAKKYHGEHAVLNEVE